MSGNQQEDELTKIDLVGHRLFGDYEVIKKLGEGGMGAVFLAKHIVIDQRIAIKVLHREAAFEEETVERFNREAHVISLLSHPNIIRVFVFGRTPDNLMYLAMEYVNGVSLADYYTKQGLPDELTAIKIIKQICSAVAEAHDLSIIHRDLKPENILLTKFRGEEYYVKILDFGIAKITESEDQKRLTQAGIVYGTPDYLAPEQAMAKPLDNRCDIYSIGVMLFEIITGKLPFEEDTVLKILQAHAFKEAPDPAEVSDYPVAKTMRDIILKCLQKDPNKRFQTAMELYDALEKREAEILGAKNLRRTRVPGGELTNMFNSVLVTPPDMEMTHVQNPLTGEPFAPQTPIPSSNPIPSTPASSTPVPTPTSPKPVSPEPPQQTPTKTPTEEPSQNTRNLVKHTDATPPSPLYNTQVLSTPSTITTTNIQSSGRFPTSAIVIIVLLTITVVGLVIFLLTKIQA